MMTCKICAHPDRGEMDKAVVDGRSLRDVAKQFEVTASSLHRHKQHIPKALAQAKQAGQIADATGLLSQVETLKAQCANALKKALHNEQWTGAAAFAREMRGCLELLGKMTGELQTGARVLISLTEIHTIDISLLTKEQVASLWDRVRNEQLREIAALTDEQIEAEIIKIASQGLSIPALESGSLEPLTIEGVAAN